MNTSTEQIFLPSTSNADVAAELQLPSNTLPTVDLENVEDFSKVCRVCAAVTELVIPIFSGEGLRNNLADKIYKHLPIKVTEQDSPELPVVMCYQCASTLLATHELVKCSMQADAALRTRARALRARRAALPQQEQKTDELKPPSSIETVESAGADERAPPAARYDAFYAALLAFREHVVSEHEAKAAYPEFSESSEAEAEAEAGAVDDLSASNLRRDRLDEATRRELSEARTRVGGKVYYACRVCGKRLSSAHTYLFHGRIHTGERPCVCHVCGKQFRAPNGLQRHVAETHERRRRRACRHCAHTFANAQNLKQHLRTHTGERPYACALCPKRFAHSGSLHAHRKTHSAALPYRCAHCPAAFRLRAGLTRHARRHAPAPAPAPAPASASARARRAPAAPPPDRDLPDERSYFVLAPL